MRKSWVVLLLLALAGTWLLLARTRGGAPDGRVQGRVLDAVRVPGRNQPLAGISARARIEVRPLSVRRIGADTASPGYHRYLNRCATCHAAPAPDLYRAAEWPDVIRRMHSNMRSAGTVGLQPADREAVLRFLARHAAR
jgi:hypothetical protein